MKPDEVAASYDQIAERWSADSFSRQNGIEQHERAIAFANPRGGHALDVGCGCSGRFLDLLIRSGYTAEGLDLSKRMIELARQRHPRLTFHHADICRWEFPRKYDFVSAWDSIWHVPLEAQERVLSRIFAGLSPGGICIFTTGGTDEPSEIFDSAMGPPMYHSALGIPRTLEVMAASGCVCRHLEYDQYPELHVYVVAQKRS